MEATISPTKAIAKREIVGPLSGRLAGGPPGGANMIGMLERGNMRNRSIFDFMTYL